MEARGEASPRWVMSSRMSLAGASDGPRLTPWREGRPRASVPAASPTRDGADRSPQ